MVVALQATTLSLRHIATNQKINNVPSPNIDYHVIWLEPAPNANVEINVVGYARLDPGIALIHMVEDEQKIRKFIHWNGAIQPPWNLLVHNNALGYTTKKIQTIEIKFQHIHDDSKQQLIPTTASKAQGVTIDIWTSNLAQAISLEIDIR